MSAIPKPLKYFLDVCSDDVAASNRRSAARLVSRVLQGSSSSFSSSSRLVFATKYGLQVEELPRPHRTGFHLTSDQLLASLSSRNNNGSGRHYGIYPEPGTSFLFDRGDPASIPSSVSLTDGTYTEDELYRILEQTNGGPAPEAYYSDADISATYSREFVDSFRAWSDQVKMGRPTAKESAAVAVEGFLLAAWLAMQPGVASVRYWCPDGVNYYDLREGDVDEQFDSILEDLKKELP